MKVSIEWAKNDLLSKLPVTIFIDERCATRLTADKRRTFIFHNPVALRLGSRFFSSQIIEIAESCTLKVSFNWSCVYLFCIWLLAVKLWIGSVSGRTIVVVALIGVADLLASLFIENKENDLTSRDCFVKEECVVY